MSIEKLRVRNDIKEVFVVQILILNFILEIWEVDGMCIYQCYCIFFIIFYVMVDILYYYNLYKRVWVIYVNYMCEEGYYFQNNQFCYMFCQSYKWIFLDSFVCVKGIFFNL